MLIHLTSQTSCNQSPAPRRAAKGRTPTVLMACVLALAGMSGSAHAESPIRIGSFLSVTGPAGYLGDPELKTLEMRIEKINKDGGVLGRQLELVNYDDGSEAAKANSFAKRLIDNDHVDRWRTSWKKKPLGPPPRTSPASSETKNVLPSSTTRSRVMRPLCLWWVWHGPSPRTDRSC